MRALVLAVIPLLATGAQARTIGDRAVSRNEAAGALYDAGRYEEALQAYKEALVERPESARLHLNVGDALFQLGDFEGALGEFERVSAADDPALAALGHYNKGNAHFQLQDYAAAVEAYKQALQRAPGDADAKANLELALQRLPPPPPQQPQEGQDQEPPQGEEEQPQNQQQPPSQEPEDEPPEPASGSRDEQPSEDEDQEPPPPEGESGMDREEAERLLDALRDREEEAQERRYRARGRDEARDW